MGCNFTCSQAPFSCFSLCSCWQRTVQLSTRGAEQSHGYAEAGGSASQQQLCSPPRGTAHSTGQVAGELLLPHPPDQGQPPRTEGTSGTGPWVSVQQLSTDKQQRLQLWSEALQGPQTPPTARHRFRWPPASSLFIKAKQSGNVLITPKEKKSCLNLHSLTNSLTMNSNIGLLKRRAYSINHVIHKGVNFCPFKSRLSTIFHYFCIST